MTNQSAAARKVLFERRLLILVTGFLIVGFLLFVIAISTDYWNVTDGGKGLYLHKTKKYFLYAHNGIWRTCRTTYGNRTEPARIIERCSYISFFPANPDAKFRVYLDYQRTMASFSIISMLVMVMGFFFSIYTFFHTRYMYKRLAAGAHLIAAGSSLIVLEMSMACVAYASNNLLLRHPRGSTWNYGYSFVLAWITFLIELMAAITFAICSRKKKKSKAPDDRFAIEEEPTIIGR